MDIVERLRREIAREPQLGDTLEEAASEIEKLRSLTRFQDGVIRSGDVATLATDERIAVQHAADTFGAFGFDNDDETCARIQMTLISLIERLSKHDA
jgi:hypothetical protein